MHMLSRRIERFAWFFSSLSRSLKKNRFRPISTINIFSSLYMRVICLCSYRVWREEDDDNEHRKKGLEFVARFHLTLAGCQLSLIGPFCYRRCTRIFYQQDQISRRRRSNDVSFAIEKNLCCRNESTIRDLQVVENEVMVCCCFSSLSRSSSNLIRLKTSIYVGGFLSFFSLVSTQLIIMKAFLLRMFSHWWNVK